jgi:hypothetical protein
MSDFWIDFITPDGRALTESCSTWVERTPENLAKLRQRLIDDHKKEGNKILSINLVKYEDTEIR